MYKPIALTAREFASRWNPDCCRREWYVVPTALDDSSTSRRFSPSSSSSEVKPKNGSFDKLTQPSFVTSTPFSSPTLAYASKTSPIGFPGFSASIAASICSTHPLSGEHCLVAGDKDVLIRGIVPTAFIDSAGDLSPQHSRPVIPNSLNTSATSATGLLPASSGRIRMSSRRRVEV
ncbi:hypothetical protein KC360_g67 [Hortaea werneckii]|nr:hypothetical protein KC344_g63 [Hortaea werneckii]KAI7180369.1 hypothetical protein KC360_g67 [Hortaea werneckii]